MAKNTLRADALWPNFYLALYPDLVRAFGWDVNAAERHYKNSGIYEGRIPNPFFNPSFYLYRYSDLQTAFGPKNWRSRRT